MFGFWVAAVEDQVSESPSCCRDNPSIVREITCLSGRQKISR
jgi:hypothetical protein